MTGRWRGLTMALVLFGVVVAAALGCTLTSSHAPSRQHVVSRHPISAPTAPPPAPRTRL